MRYNSNQLKYGFFILLIFLLFFGLIWTRQISMKDKKLINSCEISKYGCCPDNIIACDNENCLNCDSFI